MTIEEKAREQHIEDMMRTYYLQLFNEAKERNLTGEFSITFSATASLNSKEIMIQAEANIGDWRSSGKMKASSIRVAFDHAASRAAENHLHEVKLLTVDA